MPQDRVYFVADVHLPRHGSPAHPLHQAWCAWCDALLENPPQALYILGDLFEAYVGDDDLDAYQDSLNPLLALHQAGSDIFFMPGNRDFLVGEVFYSRYPIVHLGDDSACVQHWQHSLLLSHGDHWCTADEDYQKLRQQLRSTAWQSAFLHQSLEQRLAQAQALRDASKAAYQGYDPQKDVSPQAILADLQHHLCLASTQIIHGHTHRHATHTFPQLKGQSRRYVLGDWRPRGEVLCLSPLGFSWQTTP